MKPFRKNSTNNELQIESYVDDTNVSGNADVLIEGKQ